mmetsp:Transcript_20170/g.48787  ORF Transcript_20170/g.48787 Transcript_20170/m.48787 type:complete len:209 (-) Transcript_20170:137-763(-)
MWKHSSTTTGSLGPNFSSATGHSPFCPEKPISVRVLSSSTRSAPASPSFLSSSRPASASTSASAIMSSVIGGVWKVAPARWLTRERSAAAVMSRASASRENASALRYHSSASASFPAREALPPTLIAWTAQPRRSRFFSRRWKARVKLAAASACSPCPICTLPRFPLAAAITPSSSATVPSRSASSKCCPALAVSPVRCSVAPNPSRT